MRSGRVSSTCRMYSAVSMWLTPLPCLLNSFAPNTRFLVYQPDREAARSVLQAPTAVAGSPLDVRIRRAQEQEHLSEPAARARIAERDGAAAGAGELAAYIAPSLAD